MIGKYRGPWLHSYLPHPIFVTVINLAKQKGRNDWLLTVEKLSHRLGLVFVFVDEFLVLLGYSLSQNSWVFTVTRFDAITL